MRHMANHRCVPYLCVQATLYLNGRVLLAWDGDNTTGRTSTILYSGTMEETTSQLRDYKQ